MPGHTMMPRLVAGALLVTACRATFVCRNLGCADVQDDHDACIPRQANSAPLNNHFLFSDNCDADMTSVWARAGRDITRMGNWECKAWQRGTPPTRLSGEGGFFVEVGVSRDAYRSCLPLDVRWLHGGDINRTRCAQYTDPASLNANGHIVTLPPFELMGGTDSGAADTTTPCDQGVLRRWNELLEPRAYPESDGNTYRLLNGQDRDRKGTHCAG